MMRAVLILALTCTSNAFAPSIHTQLRVATQLSATTTVPREEGRRGQRLRWLPRLARRRRENPSIELSGFTQDGPQPAPARRSLIHRLCGFILSRYSTRLLSKQAPLRDSVHAVLELQSGSGRGQIQADAMVTANDMLQFPAIRMRNGSLEASCVNYHLRQRRFLGPFNLHATDITFTDSDLMKSPCIRNGLRRLLTRLLKSSPRSENLVFCLLDDIHVEGNELHVIGTATTILGQRVPFRVSSALASSNSQVLQLNDLKIVVGGITVARKNLSFDLGPNAVIESLQLRDGAMDISAQVTITPYADHRVSKTTASCSFDVANWLTKEFFE